MHNKALRRRSQGPILFSLAAACLLVLSTQPLAGAKKNKTKTKERLRSLQTVVVSGEGSVARYVRRNLEEQTCLRAPEEEGADAILAVSQRMLPCRRGLAGMCLGVSATLTDGETGKVLWFRSDEDFGSVLSLGVDQTAGKWVLWNLNGACCKGR